MLLSQSHRVDVVVRDVEELMDDVFNIASSYLIESL